MKRCLALFAIILPVMVVLISADKAHAESDWVNSAPYTLQEKPYDPNSKEKLNCTNRSLKVPRFATVTRKPNGDPIVDSATFTYDTNNQGCFTKNGMGYVGDNYFSNSPEGTTIKFYTSYGEVRFAPGESKTMIFTAQDFSPGGAGYRLSINYSPLGVSKPGFGYNSSEFVYNVTPAPFELNTSGSFASLIDSSYYFSTNGRYMATRIRLPGSPIAKIDLETKEITLIASTSNSPGGLTISNDGRYVLSTHSGLKMYDTEGCSIKFAKNQWPSTHASSETYSGCTVKDLLPQLTSQYRLESLSSSRFDYDGKAFTLDVYLRDEQNQRIQKRLHLKSSGFVRVNGYLAMGDSFASGEGDNDSSNYEIPTDTHRNSDNQENLCHLSMRSYSYLVAAALNLVTGNDFHSVACSGATTSNVIGRVPGSSFRSNQSDYIDSGGLGVWSPGFNAQKDYITGNPEISNNRSRPAFSPEAITISIGGNDAQIIGNLGPCALAGVCEKVTDMSKRKEWALEIANLRPKLVNTYNELKSVAPEARIYVIGYPVLVNDTETSFCSSNTGFLNHQERELIAESLKYVNDVIEAATKEVGVVYVDVENILDGQNLCSFVEDKDKTVNGITFGNDILIPSRLEALSLNGFSIGILGNETFHPNEKAQPLYSQRLLLQTSNLTKPMNPPSQGSFAVPSSYFGQAAVGEVSRMNLATTNKPSIRSFSPFITGVGVSKTMSIEADGFAPGSNVEMGHFSTYRKIGDFQTDSEGNLNTTISLPTDLEAGFHEIHLYGASITGEKIDYYQPITVAGPDINDVDADGITNDQDKCTFVPQADKDEDKDGVDDGCDSFISDPPTDTVAPTITGSADRQPNQNGWYNQPVTISWTSIDPEYSSGTSTTPESTIANLNGVNIYTSGESCDPAGNCAAGQLNLKIDQINPTINYSLSSSPNPAGWNNSPVTVSFDCSDGDSGISNCTTPITLNDSGTFIITGRATDLAGNNSEINLLIKIDTVGPIITPTYSLSPNSSGEFTGPVTIYFTCADTDSGILNCPTPLIYNQNGTYTVSVASTDIAGNVTSSELTVRINIPTTPKPSCNIATILNGKCKALETPTCKAHFKKGFSLLKLLTIPKGCVNEIRELRWLFDLLRPYF